MSVACVRRAARRALAVAAGCSCALQISAAERPAADGLGLRDDDIGFPSASRVIITLVIAIALTVGVTYAVRRWLPAFVSRLPSAGRIRVLESARINRGITLHLVDVDGGRVVVTEARGGVRVTPLTNSSAQTAEPRNAVP